MSGTKIGGAKAAQTNKTKYGSDFYAKIGAKGGKNGTTGGFATNKELAKMAGSKGGKMSKRGEKQYFVDGVSYGIFPTVKLAKEYFEKIFDNVKKTSSGKLEIHGKKVEVINVSKSV